MGRLKVEYEEVSINLQANFNSFMGRLKALLLLPKSGLNGNFNSFMGRLKVVIVLPIHPWNQISIPLWVD